MGTPSSSCEEDVESLNISFASNRSASIIEFNLDESDKEIYDAYNSLETDESSSPEDQVQDDHKIRRI